MTEPKTRKPYEGQKCGSKKRRQNSFCTQPAGWGTDHQGTGRCKLHGGSTPITHGRYSKVIRERLGEALERHEKDPDPLNLLPELHLARTLAERYIEKYDKAETMGIDLLGRIADLVDTIHKQRQKTGISLEALQRVVDQLGVSVARHVKDPAVLAAIESEWAGIAIS